MLRSYECGCSGDLGTRTELWFGHGCSGDRMLLEHERNYCLGMDAAGPRMLLEHARNYGLSMNAAGPRMLLEHEQKYGFGVHALVTACSCNTNGILVWAWMLLEHEVCSWNTSGIMVWAWMLW